MTHLAPERQGQAKPEMQSTYKITLRSVLATIVAVEKQ